jgi:hypothetical protein
MGKSLLAFAWVFIFGVAAYDIYFAWQHWAFFDAWEMNPLARWVAHHFGFAVLCGLKVAAIGFGGLVAVVGYRHRRRLTTFIYTTVVGGLHVALSLTYVLGRVNGYY